VLTIDFVGGSFIHWKVGEKLPNSSKKVLKIKASGAELFHIMNTYNNIPCVPIRVAMNAKMSSPIIWQEPFAQFIYYNINYNNEEEQLALPIKEIK
jgi:hypothetical protein